MINALLNGILNMISSLISIILIPVNALLNNLFPDLSIIYSTFNNILIQVSSYIGFFTYMIPPITSSILSIFLTIYISYQAIRLSYVAITKIFLIIHRIKFW